MRHQGRLEVHMGEVQVAYLFNVYLALVLCVNGDEGPLRKSERSGQHAEHQRRLLQWDISWPVVVGDYHLRQSNG